MSDLELGDHVRLGDFPAITFIKEHFSTDTGEEGIVLQKTMTHVGGTHVEYLVGWDNGTQFWVRPEEIEAIFLPEQLTLPDATPVATPLNLSDEHRQHFEELGIDLDMLGWVLRHRDAIRRHSLTQEHPASWALTFPHQPGLVQHWADMSWQERLDTYVMSIIEMASALTEFAREE